MILSELLGTFNSSALSTNPDITDLVLDSRLARPGSLFFALSGTKLDGQQFIDDAIQKGASAVLVDGDHVQVNTQQTKVVPVISIRHLRANTGKLAAQFYQYPARKMRMIGVTGTSGKTSCTQFIAAILQHLQIKCGVVGTLGNGLYGHIQPGHLTTPDAITLQKTLAEFVEQGAKITAMEVSSHSLEQNRVAGIEFDVGVFTNLTRDHLDYHLTMERYGAAKKRLFDQSRYAVINADDAFGQEILASMRDHTNIIAYGCGPDIKAEKFPVVYADNIQLSHSGIKAQIITPWGSAKLETVLVGQFNLANLLAVIATLGLQGISLDAMMQGISTLHPVAGRMQSVGGGDKPLVVIDYAHKPDALEKVLSALRQQCTGKLYCVFGCGGDRDRGKRPLMAQIAEQYADCVIVTDDNPRHEDPAQIVTEILQGFRDPAKVIVQHDRAQAIHAAIQLAAVGDCVLIAGKGAEEYQQIGDHKYPFNDLDQVRGVL